MEYRNLADFARWFLSQPITSWRPPFIPVDRYILATDDGAATGAAVHGIVIHRDPPYQVEFFSSAGSGGEASFPEHRHPNVDSIEFYLVGQIYFSIAGQIVAPEELRNAVDEDGVHKLTGVLQRVRPKDWHGAKLGPMGGAFLSIQRWKDDVTPTSVTRDWLGPAHISTTNE